MKDNRVYVLTFRPEHVQGVPEVSPTIRVRRLLKVALRSFGLRAVDIRFPDIEGEDGQHEHQEQ